MDKYDDLSREDLIARLTSLETSIASSSKLPAAEPLADLTHYQRRRAKKDAKTSERFDLTKYPCRKIALRFSYDGASYSGLATQKGKAESLSVETESVITVEDVLWKALAATRLVGDNQSMSQVGWSRCGRTDRGVSAAGQVIALWIRSRKVDQWVERRALEQFISKKKRKYDLDVREDEEIVMNGREELGFEVAESAKQSSEDDSTSDDERKRIEADPDSEELAYVSVLNAVLPSTIRVQAWSPVQSKFSARFDCRFRHYKYFFTSGCPFVQNATTRGPIPQLDIALMRLTAQKFLGDHDFRNFCKVDPSKQIDNYRRRIDGISIDKVRKPWPVSRKTESNGSRRESDAIEIDEEAMFVLNLRGTAFLYHQVRHMVAVLFLVGAKLEKPSIVDELLNVEKGGLARDRLVMRRRGLVLDDDNIQTTLPNSTATTMTGYVASDNVNVDDRLLSPSQIDPEELTEEERRLLDLAVFDRKPEYKMASDRPLMLWECGFKDTDVQWRSGSYDGPLPVHSTTTSTEEENGNTSIVPLSADLNSSTGPTVAMLHAHWSSLSITAELYKHFLLALPVDVEKEKQQSTYIPSSLFFYESSSPTLQKASILFSNQEASSCPPEAPSYTRQIIPLGDGQFRSIQKYKSLIHAKREDTPESKNARYLQGRGKLRAERKAAIAPRD